MIGALLTRLKSPSLQIGILTAAVGYLSAFIKNVDTLGIVMPMAIQAARRANQPRSAYLMPLAFESLVGATPASLNLRHRFGANLFAVRQASKASVRRLRSHRFAAGDVVLLQGRGKNLAASVDELGVLPLAASSRWVATRAG